MNFRVIESAELEIREIVDWYDAQRLGLGSEFIAEVRASFNAIKQGPLGFSRLAIANAPTDVRRSRLLRFPYLVYFRLLPDSIIVFAVGHTKRKPIYWLDRYRKLD